MRKAGGFLSGFAVALGAGIAVASGPRKKNGVAAVTPPLLDLQALRAQLLSLGEREAARLRFLFERLEVLEANAAEIRATHSPDSTVTEDAARIADMERTLAEQAECLASFRERLVRTDDHLVALLSAVDRLCESIGGAPSRKPSSAFDEYLQQEIARP